MPNPLQAKSLIGRASPPTRRLEKSSGEESAEDESKDVTKRHGERQDGGRGHHISSASGAGQATVGWQETNDYQRVARRGQEHTLEESFIVTSLHHRPWGAGDDNATIGVFSTKKEAKAAAYKDFLQRCESKADGWESKWHRCSADGMLQLRGCCEDGEDDSESYRASIKRVQQKRPVPVQPSIPSAAQPKPRVFKPRYVYVVKEELRVDVEVDPRRFPKGKGDFKALEIHGMYVGRRERVCS